MNIICARCGAVVNGARTSAKYCAECRSEVAKQKKREADRARRLRERKSRETDLNAYDTPEQIAVCLSCDLPPERCFGTLCAKLKKVK